MTLTPFDPNLKEFSDTVYLEYRDQIFPFIFGVDADAIQYNDLPGGFLKDADRYIAVDGSIHVKFEGLRDSLCYTCSYRFRDASRFQSFQDATITEWNNASNEKGELYKGAFDYFVYGYCVPPHRLVEVIVIDFHSLKGFVARRQLRPSKNALNNRSNQDFLGFSFDDLSRLGLVVAHFVEKGGILTPKKVGL